LLRENPNTIFLESFELIQPPGYLGTLEFADREAAEKEIALNILFGEKYIILEVLAG
jgi:hypothetical protein